MSRTGPTTAALTVVYTVGGTATNGVDYATHSSPVTIPAGAASAPITVTPIDDSLVEGPETVIVTLSASAAYTVGAPSSATVTITDNALPTATIVAGNAIATETGSKTGTFVVSRTPVTSAALTVFYSSAGGTATPGVDYVALPGSAVIPAGASSVAISVTLIGDSLFERDETIIVTLIANAAYVVGTPSSATVTIVSDDFSEPTLSPQATPIKAMHFTELRNAIDDARTRHGLAAFGWTNAPLVPGSTPEKALHLTELRTALTQAYAQVGKPLPNYAEAIGAGGTMIKASHLSELRMLVRNLE